MSSSNQDNKTTDNNKDDIDYKAFKKELVAQRDEYETRISEIENHIQNPPEELNKDWDDQAIVIRQNDMRQLLLNEAREGLIDVQNALSRIENGTYGECVECGRPIEKERLKAVPYSTLCKRHAV